MKANQDQIIVDIIFYYWVVGNTQKKIAEDLTWMHGVNIHQMQLSQLLRDYNFSAEGGRNRGKLSYLRHNMSDEQIKSYLHDMIFSQRLRNIEDFQVAFERQNFSGYPQKNINTNKISTKASNSLDGGTEATLGLILIVIIFICLNIFLPFWWWVDIIISIAAATLIIDSVFK